MVIRPAVKKVVRLLLLTVCFCSFLSSLSHADSKSACLLKGLHKDVPIAQVDGTQLSINIAFPDACNSQPRPVLLFIQGGGFISGDKSSNNRRIKSFTKLGFVAASAMYRLSPEHRFPTQIEDIKLAIRFLKAHAKKYHINPQRIILSGTSAGSYLAVMAGVTGNSNAFTNSGIYSRFDGSVRAVAAQSAPIGNFSLAKYADRPTVNRIFDPNAADRKAALIAMSPITYLDNEDPPFFISHGDADPLVPVDMSREFVFELKNIGHEYEYYEVQGGTHDLSDSAPAQAKEVFAAYINFLQTWAK